MNIEIPYEIGEKVWVVEWNGNKFIVRRGVYEGCRKTYWGVAIIVKIRGNQEDCNPTIVFPDSQKSAALARAKELNDE